MNYYWKLWKPTVPRLCWGFWFEKAQLLMRWGFCKLWWPVLVRRPNLFTWFLLAMLSTCLRPGLSVIPSNFVIGSPLMELLQYDSFICWLLKGCWLGVSSFFEGRILSSPIGFFSFNLKRTVCQVIFEPISKVGYGLAYLFNLLNSPKYLL